MMPTHHIPEPLLLDHAAGSLAEPVELLVATHLALCPPCRAGAARLEALGGALLEDLPGEAITGGGVDALLARIEAGEADHRSAAADPGEDADEAASTIPQPLRGYLKGPLDALGWRRRGRVSEARVLEGQAGPSANLLRIPAGAALPEHAHRGEELTLVLAGGFTDGHGHYLRGDVAVAGVAVVHRPQADADDDCLCLTVAFAPVRLTGRFARLLNPFLRV